MDLIGPAVLGKNDNSGFRDTRKGSSGSPKSEPAPPLDDTTTTSPSTSTIERKSATPEAVHSTVNSPGDISTTIAAAESSAVVEKAERPSLSYKDLIIEAIESSPQKRLKLNEIYQVSFSSPIIQISTFSKTVRKCPENTKQ
ncbi:unnamed protein product [Gongylonema pulchrum]|uniref:Fork-head domain-containing protein n=1 Tax=Gongylonema pulchrum TaxID=637853 RepID=A0A183DDT4_9BILA|nr:unnamed protein product [Gongylonema pulchrum]